MPALPYGDLPSLPGSESVRIGILLGLDGGSSVDDVELAKCVARGLMPGSAIALQETLGHVLRADLVPEATLRRAQKNQKPLSRDHSERLYELSRVTDAVSRLFHGDEPSMRAFLTRPHAMLKGETPLSLALDGSAGCTAVLNLVEKARAGVVV